MSTAATKSPISADIRLHLASSCTAAHTFTAIQPASILSADAEAAFVRVFGSDLTQIRRLRPLNPYYNSKALFSSAARPNPRQARACDAPRLLLRARQHAENDSRGGAGVHARGAGWWRAGCQARGAARCYHVLCSWTRCGRNARHSRYSRGA